MLILLAFTKALWYTTTETLIHASTWQTLVPADASSKSWYYSSVIKNNFMQIDHFYYIEGMRKQRQILEASEADCQLIYHIV